MFLNATKSFGLGSAVCAQLAIWNRIMHMNIKIHAVLRVFNQLPRSNECREFLANADAETIKNYNQLKANMLKFAELCLKCDKIIANKDDGKCFQTANPCLTAFLCR